MPPKLTNDSAEFSFRQLALARMSVTKAAENNGLGLADSANKSPERRSSIQIHKSTDSANFTQVVSRHHKPQMPPSVRVKSS